MMDAITDQGEGSLLSEKVLLDVQPRYQASKDAFKPTTPPTPTAARTGPVIDRRRRRPGGQRCPGPLRAIPRARPDRRRDEVRRGHWFAGSTWTAETLVDPTAAVVDNSYDLPSPAAIADALNNMADARQGRIRGQLPDDQPCRRRVDRRRHHRPRPYWAKPGATFPYPSMAGAGDRMSICWALFGRAPDLSVGIGDRRRRALPHVPGAGHRDTGRRLCGRRRLPRLQGLEHLQAGGRLRLRPLDHRRWRAAGPRSSRPRSRAPQRRSQGQATYSAPSDNKCAALGGCASPISASQLLPRPGRRHPTRSRCRRARWRCSTSAAEQPKQIVDWRCVTRARRCTTWPTGRTRGDGPPG